MAGSCAIYILSFIQYAKVSSQKIVDTQPPTSNIWICPFPYLFDSPGCDISLKLLRIFFVKRWHKINVLYLSANGLFFCIHFVNYSFLIIIWGNIASRSIWNR